MRTKKVRGVQAQNRFKKLKGELAGEITNARKKKNITQAELAKEMSVSKEYVSLLERGLRLPSVDTLFDLSEATDSKLKITFE